MKIGLISDTHGRLPALVHTVLKEVELILHAGDIGEQDVIRELETIAPVRAVHGNIDSWPLKNIYPAMLNLDIHGMKICITHNIVSFQYFTFELFRRREQPDLVVFGHTHKPVYESYRNIKFINPGSVYRPKGGSKKSLAVINQLGPAFKPEFINLD